MTMSEIPPDAALPGALPVLSRGRHRDPARGACFMEYTALLAGEPFTDHPRCVDPELAAVLRGANDTLSDADRPLLVPLLGRTIGLAAGSPPARVSWRAPAEARRRQAAQRARYRETTARLQWAVAVRFTTALGLTGPAASRLWEEWDRELSWLFWDLLGAPPPPAGPQDQAHRLVDRLHLLHDCYERAMQDLGLPRTTGTGSRPAAVPAVSPAGAAVDSAP
jgi:hypothetical protein